MRRYETRNPVCLPRTTCKECPWRETQAQFVRVTSIETESRKHFWKRFNKTLWFSASLLERCSTDPSCQWTFQEYVFWNSPLKTLLETMHSNNGGTTEPSYNVDKRHIFNTYFSHVLRKYPELVTLEWLDCVDIVVHTSDARWKYVIHFLSKLGVA